jgi:SAM-dependent methyltransferase
MRELPDISYQYDETFMKYMHEQIWECKKDINVYHTLAKIEFSHFYDHIETPKDILEVGSGLGRGTIYLNKFLNDVSASFTLADRTGYTNNTGVFNPRKDEYYNDLSLTKKFCELNGVNNVETFDTELDDWSKLKKFDFIFSLCSFGMHVKIERYMERLLSVSKESTIMIFGVRDDSYTENSFIDLFEHVIYREDTGINPVHKENWLILKYPKIIGDENANAAASAT